MTAKTFAHYEILQKLGEGPRGEVFLAHDTELDRKVALKIPPASLVADPDALAGFLTAARTAAGLHHPNIVTVYEIGDHQGRPFVAMEYVEGRSLRDVLGSGSLKAADCLDLAVQVCRGLAEAHKHGVIHGDLGPDHVLIGPTGRVRILDFGLAPRPEGPGPAVDLHAVGVMIYEMVVGRPPDPGTEDVSRAGMLASEGVSGQPRSEQVLRHALGRIVERALAVRSRDRYASAAEMAADLQRLLGDETPAILGRQASSRPRRLLVAAALLAVVLAAIALLTNRNRPAPVADERKLVVVLPFANLGAPEDDYFADGITAEITARLSALDQLGVISRTSAAMYRGTQKPISTIADELGVSYVIEGTIRWDKTGPHDRVRITPQLIRVADDTHLWAQTYEREITEIFAVQTDIATRIVEALDVGLLDRERTALTERPTDSVEAYQAYLRGSQLLWQADYGRESFALTIQMFERAVALDPGFAQAYAGLSAAYSRSAHYGFDRSEEHLATARTLVDRALELKPGLAEAHLALGLYYYWARRDYERALAALDDARALGGDTAEILQVIGYVKRRQGDMAGSAAVLEQSLELNPLDALTNVTIGETYSALRDYARGARFLERAVALAPDQAYPYTELALVYLRWRGDTEAARRTLAAVPIAVGTEPCRVGFLVELLDRDYAAALARLDDCTEPVLEAGVFYIPVPLLRGIVHGLARDAAAATAAYAAARATLEARLAENPDDHRVHAALGIALAGLGEPEAAVAHGRRAVELYPLSRDALEAPTLLVDLALIYTMTGDHAAALHVLDQVLSVPSILSAAWLEIDPRWDPLRQEAGFRSLLARHAGGR